MVGAFIVPFESFVSACAHLHGSGQSARSENGVYGPAEAVHFKSAPSQSPSLSPSSLYRSSFSSVTHAASSLPPLSSFFKKHPSAPRNVNSPGFKYARSELGVNHHFVFITHSLSSLSRCARGMRSSGVMEVFVLLLAPVLCLPASAPPKGCGSPLLVFRPNESCDWLGGLFPARPSTRLT